MIIFLVRREKMSVLGDRLRAAREKKGLSQIEVFRRIKINNKTLSRYENGGTEPDIDTLKLLAELYDVSINYLTGFDEDERKEKTKEELIIEEKMKLAEQIINLPEAERKLIEDMIRTLQNKNK